jgi:hypothetical protein
VLCESLNGTGPLRAALVGGAVVLGALAVNELAAFRAQRLRY